MVLLIGFLFKGLFRVDKNHSAKTNDKMPILFVHGSTALPSFPDNKIEARDIQKISKRELNDYFVSRWSTSIFYSGFVVINHIITSNRFL